MQFLYVNWNINPEIFRIGDFALRYYSLMFLAAFFFSYIILSKIYNKENIPIIFLNKLFLYVFVGTLAGARLGHCLFYEFDYYRHHVLEIILPFRVTGKGQFELTGYQGLASHGGAIGILIAVWMYYKKYRLPLLWILDRLMIAVAIAGMFIRVGNFFNSEIIGKQTNLPWAVVFERVDNIPRHPAQLYEAVCYLFLFIFLWWFYKIKITHYKRGFLFGLFLVLLFSSRFMIEFVKEEQEAFENTMRLNMGQLLSLPFIAFGVYLVYIKRFKQEKIADS
jgi:prolipoprotein diacylglyceryl transferase